MSEHRRTLSRPARRRLQLASASSLVAVAVLLSCTEPVIVEPEEASKKACRNAVDDDADELVDCEDGTCIEGGFCAAFETDCGVLPPDGCPRGMACYSNENEQRGSVCSVPGTKGYDEPCEGAGSCRADLHCLGVCRTLCFDGRDCARDTFCVRAADWEFGTCSIPCVPAFEGKDCRAGTCVPAHMFLTPFDGFQIIALCADRPAWDGTAAEGEPCDDPPTLTNLSRMCEFGLVCVPLPDGSGPVCHSTCGLTEQGDVTLPCQDPDKRCMEAFPLDSRPILGNQILAGLCITP